jgi:hypothetical protein
MWLTGFCPALAAYTNDCLPALKKMQRVFIPPFKAIRKNDQ